MLITRFAPSPTGSLHLGGARLALFNMLYSRRHNGRFLLRIEDTDVARSTEESKQSIIDTLKWLEIEWDGDIVFQMERIQRHKEVVQELISQGKAYHCYLTKEEIEDMRNKCHKIISPWSEGNTEPRRSVRPVVRLKSDQNTVKISKACSFNPNNIILHDTVQGDISVKTETLDDMVLLRSDGTPTYMLAVVVDDHDMGVNHIIRGDDHITNTFRQIMLYVALNWEIPTHSHIPMIHSSDGARLSKRHNASGLEYYRDMGYLPDALCNYLLSLGWAGKQNKEIISINEAVEIFDISDISKAPSRLDINKLNHINSHYIKASDDLSLIAKSKKYLNKEILNHPEFTKRLLNGMQYIKNRANTLIELAKLSEIYFSPSTAKDEDIEKLIKNKEILDALRIILSRLEKVNEWNIANIKNEINNCSINKTLVMKSLRASIARTSSSIGIYEIMSIIGKDDTIKRIIETLKDD